MAKIEYTLQTPFVPLKYNYTGKEGEIKGKPTKKIEATVVLSGAALEEMKANVETFIADHYPAKKAKAVVRPFKDKDGETCLTFVTYAAEKDGTPKTVAMADSLGRPVKRKGVALGKGSVVRIKAGISPTEYEGKDYIKFWLNGIQVKTRVEPTAGGAGFDAVEGGEDGWTGDEFDDDGGTGLADEHDGPIGDEPPPPTGSPDF